MVRSVRTVLIDNYDSYSYNLYHLLWVVNGAEPVVVENDRFQSYEELVKLVGGSDSFENIVISPGPGRPEREEDFGGCLNVIRNSQHPVLGVCLGHQGLASAFGAEIVHAAGGVAHGLIGQVYHNGEGLFDGLPQEFDIVRYHSLAVNPKTLPECLEITAWCKAAASTDHVVMGLQHTNRSLYGVQFHPESICTEFGTKILQNFFQMTLDHMRRHKREQIPKGLQEAPREDQTTKRSTSSLKVHWNRLALGPKASRDFSSECFEELYGESSAPCFWLDSPPRAVGARFSYMGDASGPHAELIVSTRSRSDFVEKVCTSQEQVCNDNFFQVLNSRLESRFLERDPGLPFPFSGGFVGYIGYEMKEVCGALPGRYRSKLPDAMMLFADRFLVFDHVEQYLYIVCLGYESWSDKKRADDWIDEVVVSVKRLLSGSTSVYRTSKLHQGGRIQDSECERPVFYLERDSKTYMSDIRRCLQEIHEGETYEVCLTNRIRSLCKVNPLALYRTLRQRNDASYCSFLRFSPDWAVCCSSPERFLSISAEGDVESKPIKGTRRRSKDPKEDELLRYDLLTSSKDRAENLMIVDLVRNDLGRTCQVGSVTVPRLMEVESYNAVHQLVSTVQGKLVSAHSGLECLRSAFPMGSMTGAPKIRTMKIIDEVEASPRGIFSGSIGFLSLSGEISTNVVIRSAVVSNSGVEIGAGGAIVALSNPEEEFEEVLIKARPLMEAVALTATGCMSYILEGAELQPK